MSSEKFISDSYCVGGRHRSATKSSHGDITNKGSKVLIGFCSNCHRKKLWLLVIILYKQKVSVTSSRI